MSRGRPSNLPPVKLDKWELKNTTEDGIMTTYKFDRDKSPNGCFEVETKYPKSFRSPKIKIEKGKAYNQQPVVMVFATSNRSNAKTKIKVWKNENIDYLISADKLPGVPDKAVILELGVGVGMITRYKEKYKLK